MNRKRKYSKDLRCPLEYGIHAISGKWKSRVMRTMKTGESLRFGELIERLPGISPVALTSALQDLADLDMVERREFDETPPHVEYSLTEKGTSLFPILEDLCKWAARYHPCITEDGSDECRSCEVVEELVLA